MIPGCEFIQVDDQGLNKPYHLIGGADVAAELDAKRAIDQAARLTSELVTIQHPIKKYPVIFP